MSTLFDIIIIITNTIKNYNFFWGYFSLLSNPHRPSFLSFSFLFVVVIVVLITIYSSLFLCCEVGGVDHQLLSPTQSDDVFEIHCEKGQVSRSFADVGIYFLRSRRDETLQVIQTFLMVLHAILTFENISACPLQQVLDHATKPANASRC